MAGVAQCCQVEGQAGCGKQRLASLACRAQTLRLATTEVAAAAPGWLLTLRGRHCPFFPPAGLSHVLLMRASVA